MSEEMEEAVSEKGEEEVGWWAGRCPPTLAVEAEGPSKDRLAEAVGVIEEIEKAVSEKGEEGVGWQAARCPPTLAVEAEGSSGAVKACGSVHSMWLVRADESLSPPLLTTEMEDISLPLSTTTEDSSGLWSLSELAGSLCAVIGSPSVAIWTPLPAGIVSEVSSSKIDVNKKPDCYIH